MYAHLMLTSHLKYVYIYNVSNQKEYKERYINGKKWCCIESHIHYIDQFAKKNVKIVSILRAGDAKSFVYLFEILTQTHREIYNHSENSTQSFKDWQDNDRNRMLCLLWLYLMIIFIGFGRTITK